MKKLTFGLAALMLVAGLGRQPARAGGSGRRVTSSGLPAKWDNKQPIFYDLTPEPSHKSTKEGTDPVDPHAETFIARAFDQWANIDTACLTFREGVPLDRPVTGGNILDFFHRSLTPDQNPVILDPDGGVTETLLGKGASRQVLAFGQILQATPEGKITQSMVVLNGGMVEGPLDPDNVSQSEMMRATVRAIGQMLNVGDSDLNDELILDGSAAHREMVPVMHPGRRINGDCIALQGGGFTPTLDDRIAVSTLYPAPSFDAQTGMLRGQVLLPDGTTGLQGIDVIARRLEDPLQSAVSVISGAGFEGVDGLGSREPGLRGAFEMHLPPGSYTLQFRPLRHEIGPLQVRFPLPGGPQFYRASPAPTAGTADVGLATPITVTAGHATEIRFVTPGIPAPPPRMVASVTTPHDSVETAQPLPLSASVHGRVAPSAPGTPGQIVRDTGGGQRDKIEDLYRLDVPQRSILTLRLEAREQVDLDLYVFNGFPGGAASPVIAESLTSGTDPEALQTILSPGVYFIGVSAWDDVPNPAATDYTLDVVTTPLPRTPPPHRPVLDQLVVGNVTDRAVDVSWVTDVNASADVLVAMPRTQLGDPSESATHHVAVTGLTPGTNAVLTAVSQNALGQVAVLPTVSFRTAESTATAGPAEIRAVLSGVREGLNNGDGGEQKSFVVAISLLNSGGPATQVQITGLTASPGWKLAQPLSQALWIGGIGSNGTAMVVLRLLPDGPGPAPLATVTGTGTLADARGTTACFAVGP